MNDIPDDSIPARRSTDTVEAAPLSVSQVTTRIKALFESTPAFQSVMMVGEISNFKHHQGRHMYFSLKDAGAEMKCVFFSPTNRAIKFVPADGVEVIVRGSITVYPERGYYQFYVKTMTQSGEGLLYRKYEELKKKLVAEGVTDAARKRPLPLFPGRIGIVASSESAGLRDILNVLERRYPLATVVMESVAVEGEGSAPSIAEGLIRMARYGNADVVIVGRGGGSIESLWGFNTEVVARAIVAMPVPVISAVGHETDTTIADLVADRRAATPTEAAELATPSIVDLKALIEERRASAMRCMAKRLKSVDERLRLVGRTLRSPEAAINLRAQRLDHLGETLSMAPKNKILASERRLQLIEKRLLARSPFRMLMQAETRLGRSLVRARHLVTTRYHAVERRLALLETKLTGANPTAILERGYAIAMKDGKTIRTSESLLSGDTIDVRFHRGSAECEVKGTR